MMKRYFKKTEDGKWQHYINDELRATIEDEHFDDYKKSNDYLNDPVIE